MLPKPDSSNRCSIVQRMLVSTCFKSFDSIFLASAIERIIAIFINAVLCSLVLESPVAAAQVISDRAEC